MLHCPGAAVASARLQAGTRLHPCGRLAAGSCCPSNGSWWWCSSTDCCRDPPRRHKVVDYIRKERVLLDALDHPGIARLFFTFQDAYSLYLGLEHCPNGARSRYTPHVD